MAKPFKSFQVQGSGPFPLDMLRYDACYPRTSEDASKIGELGRRIIELVTTLPTPTIGRWNSFNWEVIEYSP